MLVDPKHPIAYFCAEFGIDSDLPTYAGGLGILAADVMNAAADEDTPFVGIGILYKGREFLQHITGNGKAETRDSEFDHDTSFLRPTTDSEGRPIIIKLPHDKNEVKAKVYHVRLADNTVLYFLSTDVDGNPHEWISDMDTLYKGDAASQIRQEILLGIGGVKLLEALGMEPLVYHMNEGRSAYLIWELTSSYMQKYKLSFNDAWEKAKSKIVYTNHTLVAAGNPTYDKNLLNFFAGPYANKMGIDSEQLVKPGLTDANTFNLTFFALNISTKRSGVSKVHAEYAKKSWPGFDFVAITNGVHMPRWQDSDFRNPSQTDEEIWKLHLVKKEELLTSVIKRTGFGYDPNSLVITWARRLADYKQPRAIFTDIKRLKKILDTPGRPIQFLFAGNSHTGDPTAKSIIEDIIRMFSQDLSGHAIFVPNYNISLANHLTSGSDIWLNTPKGNLEACGTSGMKAMSNGVLNCTVLDGWTYEVNWEGIGWTLEPNNVAESFYKILESDIAPQYFSRNQNGLPEAWLKRMKNSIAESKRFSAQRMFEEYKAYLYS